MTSDNENLPTALQPEFISQGVEIEATPHALATGGMAVARTAGLVVFVERGLPGQKLRVRITRRKKRHAEAEILEVLQPGEQEITPPCPHFAHCGGCSWQHLDYGAQLEWKRRLVAESLQRIGGAGEVHVPPTVSSPQQFQYRNKMEFAFAGGGADLRLGLRKPGSHEVFDLQTCLLPPEEVVQAVHVFRELCAGTDLPSWDGSDGFWRFLVLRAFQNEDGLEMLAELITAPVAMWDAAALEVAANALRRLAAAGLRGVVHGVRHAASQIAQSNRIAHTEGAASLQTRLVTPAGQRLHYSVSSGAFFQTNSAAAGLLAGLVRQWAQAEAEDVVWDVYCGGGGPGLFLAQDARLLAGFDASSEAVADARNNASANGLGNCVFRAGDVRTLLPREREQPDVVLLDPPRAGLPPEVCEELLRRGPRRIISISCNPATQARDVSRLLAGYRLERVQPLDLFPQTHHVENLALLVRK